MPFRIHKWFLTHRGCIEHRQAVGNYGQVCWFLAAQTAKHKHHTSLSSVKEAFASKKSNKKNKKIKKECNLENVNHQNHFTIQTI